MDALDLLTVLCAVLALAAAGALTWLCTRVLHAARALDAAVVDFESSVAPAVEELRAAAVAASTEVERLDDLLDVAVAVGDRLDSATEVTYRALTSPVIKGVAFASGTRRAARRLSGRPLDTAGDGPSRDTRALDTRAHDARRHA